MTSIGNKRPNIQHTRPVAIPYDVCNVGSTCGGDLRLLRASVCLYGSDEAEFKKS